MQSQPPVSRTEFDKAKAWFDENQSLFPVEVAGFFARILAVYFSLVQGKSRARQTYDALRRAMGLLAKSERGSSDAIKPPEPLPQLNGEIDPEQKAAYEAMRQKRDELIAKKKEYHEALKRAYPKEISPQLELALAPAFEMQFSYPFSDRKTDERKQVVNRMQEFDRETGLHVSIDHVKRVNLQVVVTDIDYSVETVTDLTSGKSVRASMADIGPEGFQYTWQAIGNLVKMHVGFAIPINRMVMMIGQKEFTSSNICRSLSYSADFLLPIYLVFADQLGDVRFYSGDDTSTKVIDLDENLDEGSLSRRLDERFGWASPRADGNGDKKALNVSLLIGRTEDDPRSTIRFFRTHQGSVGNLLDKILETRLPQNKELYLLGDLSTSNLPRSEEIRRRFKIILAGCGAHARRPFFRMREDDVSLCYYMLKGFLKLAHLEHVIDTKGRTRDNVLKYRGRYGRMFWEAMKNRCEAAVTGQVPGFATYPKGITPDVWPPSTDLYVACKYVINHFEKLTLYLSVPELPWTNNGSERALRVEKSMLDTSKFRKTREGRAQIDILRTVNATSTAAGLDIGFYMSYLNTHRDEYLRNPERFTPFEVARRLELERNNQPDKP